MPVELSLRRVVYTSGIQLLLRGVTFTAWPGETLLICGRSGCGKSTLLELAAGLKRPDRGQIFWDGIDIARYSREELLIERRRIGYMFQQHALIANYSIFDNIALPLRVRGTMQEREIRSRVSSLMEETALFNVDHCFPEALSAGQLKSATLAF